MPRLLVNALGLSDGKASQGRIRASQCGLAMKSVEMRHNPSTRSQECVRACQATNLASKPA
eukprot:2731741-Amphidinium_carterae.1